MFCYSEDSACDVREEKAAILNIFAQLEIFTTQTHVAIIDSLSVATQCSKKNWAISNVGESGAMWMKFECFHC